MKNALFFLFCTFSIVTFSQKFDWEHGETYPGNYKGDQLLFLGQLNDEFQVVISQQHQENTLTIHTDLLDYSMHPVKQTEQKFSFSAADKTEIITCHQFEDKIVMYTLQFVAVKKQTQLIAYTLTNNGIDLENEMILDEFPAYSMHNPGHYRLNFSADNKLLVALRELPTDKNKNEAITVKAFDYSHELIFQIDHVFDQPAQTHPVNIPFINNAGDVFVVKKDRDKTQFRYSVFAIDNSTHNWSGKPINVTGIFITDIRASFNNKQQLVLAGFYSTISYNEYEGLFYFSFDNHANITGKNNLLLSPDTKSLFLSKKEANKDGTGIPNFSLQHIMAIDSGGVYILAEKCKVITENQHKEVYDYGEIFVVNLDQLGNFKWARKVDKHQISENDKGKWDSYICWKYGDTLCFLYNKVMIDAQLESTGERKKNDEFGKFTFAGPTLATITPDGTQKYLSLTTLFSEGNKQKAINPAVFSQVENQLWMLSESYFGEERSMIHLTISR